MPADLAFGITAASRPDHRRLGTEVEHLGYTELWVNDTRRGDGVAALAEIRSGTTSLRLGLGVVALSEHDPRGILGRLRASGLPLGGLTVGVGSGASSSLELVRTGVTELRALLPGVPIAIAAVGPRMFRLAGEIADAVVAGWANPERLGWARDRIGEGADAASRPPPRLVAYVRTALGQGAADRLRAAMAQYRAYGIHYARAFEAQRDDLVGVAVASADPAQLADSLAPYRSAVDTLVVRGLPADDSVDAWLEVAGAAMTGLSGGRGR
jgi:alkanesulfonate monooxygenase SsuD/methylene tetrahydromethanopterin reductase-like flavin-dependent oxidoreductase (luciferase family)